MTLAHEFKDAAASMLADAEGWCRSMFPHGKVRGREFRVGGTDGEKGESLCVWLDIGGWKDYATGQSGSDLVSLWAARHGITQIEALAQITGREHDHAPRPYIGSQRRAVSLVPDMTHREHGQPTHQWEYISADGEVLGYVCRYDLPNGKKTYCPWTLQEGKWMPKGFASPKPLYGAHELAQRDTAPVLICEGEKAADAARKASPEHVCITWPGGASAVLQADWSDLAGREVLLWPDADEPGRKAMDKLAGQLASQSCHVLRIDTEGYGGGWDAADAAFTPSQFRAWLEPRRREVAAKAAPLLREVDISDIERAELLPPLMAVDPIIPMHQVTLLSGHGGAGKSQLMLAICAHVAAGQPWGGFSVAQGPVVFLSLEDPADVVRFRLKRICAVYELPFAAVLANLRVLDGTDSEASLAVEQNVGGVRSLVFTRVMDELEKAANGARVVAIDNASDAYGGDETIRRQVRAFVAGLARMARRLDAAVVLLAHIDKQSAKNGSQGESYSGSTGWHNSVRSRLAIVQNKDANTITMEHEKNNLGPKASPLALEFEAGVIIPMALSQTIEHLQRNNEDEQLIAAFRAAERAGVIVPAAMSGPHQWHHALSGFPEFKPFENDAKRRRSAINRLLRNGELVETTYKKGDRKDGKALELPQRTAANRPESAAVIPQESAAIPAAVLSPIPPSAGTAAPWEGAAIPSNRTAAELPQASRTAANHGDETR